MHVIDECSYICTTLCPYSTAHLPTARGSSRSSVERRPTSVVIVNNAHRGIQTDVRAMCVSGTSPRQDLAPWENGDHAQSILQCSSSPASIGRAWRVNLRVKMWRTSALVVGCYLLFWLPYSLLTLLGNSVGRMK